MDSSREVLPAPLAPMSATISPGRTSNETPFRTVRPDRISVMSRARSTRQAYGLAESPAGLSALDFFLDFLAAFSAASCSGVSPFSSSALPSFFDAFFFSFFSAAGFSPPASCASTVAGKATTKPSVKARTNAFFMSVLLFRPQERRQYCASAKKVQPYLLHIDVETSVSYAYDMRRLLATACVTAAVGLASAQTAPSEMSIEQAISFALAHHPSLRARAAL